MIVDTSALIAILRDAPEAEAFAHGIESSVVRRLSAANFVEAAVIKALRILKRAGAGNPPMKGDELRAKRGRR